MSLLYWKKKVKDPEKTKKTDPDTNHKKKKPRKDCRVDNNLQTEWLSAWQAKH